MTIIVGLRFLESVLFISDTQTHIFEETATGIALKPEKSPFQKIIKIRKDVMIGTSGLANIGQNISGVIRSILCNPKYSTEEIIECCYDIMKHSHLKFIKYNRPGTYNGLASLVGGIDEFTREPYLYYNRSDRYFEFDKVNLVKVIGTEPVSQVIEDYINVLLKNHPNHMPYEYLTTICTIIRDNTTENDYVGEDFYCYEINNSKGSATWFFNSQNESIDIPEGFVNK